MMMIERDDFLRVVAMSAEGAREFCIHGFGMDPSRIDRIEEGGPSVQPDKYKDGARTWHVYTKQTESKSAVVLEEYKTYQLTRDVINPSPDRRQRHDWRALETWKAWTRFYAHTRNFAHGSALDGLSDEAKLRVSERDREIWIYTGRYSHQDIGPNYPAYALIVSALEPVEDFDALMHEIRAEHNVTPTEVLRYLMEERGIYPINADLIRDVAGYIAEDEAKLATKLEFIRELEKRAQSEGALTRDGDEAGDGS